MSTRGEISSWLIERVEEIESRNTDPADPHAEDVRQLAKSLRSVLGAAQTIEPIVPNVAETIFKHAASPFSGHPGYDNSWDT